MADVIDLRKQKKYSRAAPRTVREDIEEEYEEVPESVEWSAPEYEERMYSQNWFIGMGIVATIFIVIGILARSYFFVTLMVLAFVVVVLYARRPPVLISFAITPKGVQAGKTFYEFSHLKSFWVFENDNVKELSLETEKLLSPYIRIPLGKMRTDEIEPVIGQYLAKKEHEDTVPDQIARGVGF